MSLPINYFRLPIKKIPLWLDFKIRSLLWWKNLLIIKENIYFNLPIKKMAVITLSVIILVVSSNFGVKTYAYTAESVVPGHLLYNLRKNIEFAKINATNLEPVRINLYLDYAQKRIKEADYILNNSQDGLVLIPSAYAEDINVDLTDSSIVNELIVESNNLESMAFKELNYIKDAEMLNSLVDDVANRKELHQQNLTNLKNKLLDNKNKLLFDKIYQTNANNWQQFDKIHADIKLAKQGGNKKIMFEFKPDCINPMGKEEHHGKKFPRKHMEKLNTMFELKEIQRLNNIPPLEMKKIHDEMKSKMEKGEMGKAKAEMKKIREKCFKNGDKPHPCQRKGM